MTPARAISLSFFVMGAITFVLFVVVGSVEHGVAGGVLGAVVVGAGLSTAWRMLRPTREAYRTQEHERKVESAGAKPELAWSHRFRPALWGLAVLVVVGAALVWLSGGGSRAVAATVAAAVTVIAAIYLTWLPRTWQSRGSRQDD